MTQANSVTIARPWPVLRRRQVQRPTSRAPQDVTAKALASKRREARAQAARDAAHDTVVWSGRSFL